MTNNKKPIKVLSLFDGISGGRLALERLGIVIDTYVASEVNKNAIKVTQHHYPDTIQVGDITKLEWKNGVLRYYSESNESYQEMEFTPDIIIGGSPCQDFSTAKAHLTEKDGSTYGLKGEKSRLFYDYLRLLNAIKPKYFLLENVNMRKDSKKQLDDYLGVEGLLINSELFSYQKRSRVYWTNIPFERNINDRKISFQDYKEDEGDEKLDYTIPNKTKTRINMWNNGKGREKNSLKACANITHSDKIFTVTTKQDRAPNSGLIQHKDFCRFLSRKELEIAQTIPVGYTDMLSYRQMQEAVGNGWTIDVIAHILKPLVNEYLVDTPKNFSPVIK